MQNSVEREKYKILKELAGNQKEEKPQQVSFLETEEFIAEQILGLNRELGEHSEQPLGVCFAKFNKRNSEITYVSELEKEGDLYTPVKSTLIGNGTIILPSCVEKYSSMSELVEEIKKYIFDYVELPDFYHQLLPYLVLFYWLSDKYPFLPYVHFVGLTGTGKSVALDALGYISYKAIRCSGSLSIASIFRLANQFKGTLLLNEFELGSKESEHYTERLQILKSGTEDFPVFRVEGEGKKEVEAFNVKSPRIFASQHGIPDAALASRTIEIHMSVKTRELPLYRLEGFFKRAEAIRNKLLYWRFANYDKVNLKEIEYGIPELKHFDGRVQQIMTPIYHLADENTRSNILVFMKQKEEETKRERLEELDGLIFTIVLASWEANEDLLVGGLTSEVNKKREHQGYKTTVTEKKVGIVVRKNLGIETERTNEGYRLVLTPKKVKELKKHFGIVDTLQESTQRSLSSPISHENISEVHPWTLSEASETSSKTANSVKYSLEEFPEVLKNTPTETLELWREKALKKFDLDLPKKEINDLHRKMELLDSELLKRGYFDTRESNEFIKEAVENLGKGIA